MADFTLKQNEEAFETIWEYQNDTHVIIVAPVTLLTYNYSIYDLRGEPLQEDVGKTATELVSALETFLGETVDFPESVKGETPTPS
jgi:hypothetical protein